MKQKKWIALLCAALLCFSACAKAEKEEPKAEKPSVDAIYGYESIVRERTFTEESTGMVYASYRYSVPMLLITNANDLDEETSATALRNTEVFNAKMQEVLDESVAFGDEIAQEHVDSETFYAIGLPLADEKILSLTKTGDIISVMVDGYFYGGGAHPYGYAQSYTFDLSLGQFIDPTQIAEDPEAFRIQTAALLVEKAEGLGEDYVGGFFPDYAETISHWNERAVLFNESGMTVIFSVYDLGPYAMGPVELQLTYEELSEIIGNESLARLGYLPSAE